MSELDPFRWEQAQALFHRCLDGAAIPDIEQASLDPLVRSEAKRLLELHLNQGEFLKPPQWSPTGPNSNRIDDRNSIPVCLDQEVAAAGDLVGNFRLIRKISSGGMGEVWLAERADEQFHQVAAIKISRTNASQASLERFFDEREALANLEHPSITRLIDGGMTGQGCPFLVMEFVDGIPIDQFVSERRLGVTDAVRLFIEVCEAVQFAHQSLIVHCDLKPSNILVSGSGRPRVLDFGICRLLQKVDSESNARLSQPLTPGYASPEQCRGEPCTTASDVFSLGVILRAMLDPGLAPAQVGLLTRIGLANGDSTGLNRTAKILHPHAFQKKRTRTSSDLDWILDKATQENPARRYASVRELADDLSKFLSFRPVTARPQSKKYRTRMWVRRNAILTLSFSIFLLAAALGVAGIIRAWQGESAERQAARATVDFLENLLGNSTLEPSQASLRLLMDASRQAGNELADRPSVELSVRMSLARIYASMWKWNDALIESQRAFALASSQYGLESDQVANALTITGRAQTWLHDPLAVETQRKCLRIRQSHNGERNPKTAESHINLGFALWWTTPRERWSEAAAEYESGLHEFRASGSTDSGDYARALYSYANFESQYGGVDSQSLLAVARESIDVFSRCHDRANRYSRGALITYATLLAESSGPETPIPNFAGYLSLWPPEVTSTPELRVGAWYVGQLLQLQGENIEAFKMYKRALSAVCVFHSSEAGDRWDQADQALNTIENSESLLSWIETWLLSGIENCGHEHKQLLQHLTWPILLAENHDHAESMLARLLEMYVRKYATDAEGLKLMNLTLAEEKMRSHRSVEYQDALAACLHEFGIETKHKQFFVRRANQSLQAIP